MATHQGFLRGNLMTGKQARKQYKRRRMVAAIATQNAWIEQAFGVEATTRRERDRLFAQAKPIMEAKHAAR